MQPFACRLRSTRLVSVTLFGVDVCLYLSLSLADSYLCIIVIVHFTLTHQWNLEKKAQTERLQLWAQTLADS